MKRLLNSIFYCLFLFVLIMPVFSENISLSQDDLTKLQTLLNQSIQNNSKNENEENYIRKERSYGEFTRSFYVENIEEENIKAKFNDGELEITLPKKNKNIENSRKIAIE